MQNDIIGYKPVSGDLAYPEKLEMMEVIAILNVLSVMAFLLILYCTYRVSRKDYKIKHHKLSDAPFPSLLSRRRIQFVLTLEVMLYANYPQSRSNLNDVYRMSHIFFSITRDFSRIDAVFSVLSPRWPWPISPSTV